jgi:hypothetical protein
MATSIDAGRSCLPRIWPPRSPMMPC